MEKIEMPPTVERFWEQRLRFLCALFRYTLLCVPVDQRWTSKVRWFGASFIISIVAYQTAWTLYRTIVDDGEFLVTSLAFFCWYLHALFSMCFCVYWQVKGHLQEISAAFTAHREQMGGESPHKTSRATAWVFGGCVGILCIAIVAPFFLYYFHSLESINVKTEIAEAFGGRGTGAIGIAVSGYCLFVLLFVMHAYVLTTLMAHREVVEFNEQLKAIGTKDDGRMAVANELTGFYERQISLTAIVRQLNNTFEVYAFVMLGTAIPTTAIPTTIFTIVTFIQRLRHSAYFSAAFMTTGFSLCIVELIALTFTPAKIHTTAREVEAILFENKRIWIPFHDAAYQTAALLIAHVNKTSWGVSAWGFVLLSKPLILSVVSLTVTYLVLLVQMGSQGGIQ